VPRGISQYFPQAKGYRGWQQTPKAAVESKMAAAINIFLYSSSVIIVGCKICLAYVELYGRNSSKGNITIFPSSQGIYPVGCRIYPKCREIPIELETIVTVMLKSWLLSVACLSSFLPIFKA
jgi:hypothetical protein